MPRALTGRAVVVAGEAPAADPGWRDVLIAVDVGTSGARAVAIDLDGRRRLEARAGYPTSSPRPGWAEQDPRAWRRASLTALSALVRALGPGRRVHGIGLTGQCPSVCLVDRRGRPIGPGLIYRDNRAVAESDDLRRRFGDAAIHRLTGHLPSAFHVGPKLAWLRRHEPALWREASVALQPRDLVALALTGELATDGTHAAATLAYDLRAGAWSDDLLEALGLPASVLPRIRPPWGPLGALRPAVASRIGLPGATPVILGGADSQACALGAGVVEPGPVSEMAGSSTCLNAVVREPLDVALVTHYPHVIPGSFTTETGINTSGAAIGWMADLLYGGKRGHAAPADYLRLDREVLATPPGADGVLALPVLGDGERTDADLRGAVSGLSLRHDRAVLARAFMEGVAHEIREQLGLLRQGGAAVTALRISGGDTRLTAWNRIKADVIGLPVTIIPGDATATGVAMLAGLGAGAFRDLGDAIARCVHPGPPILPVAAAHDLYEERYTAYEALATSGVVHVHGARSRSRSGPRAR
jgi:sugar (pentulose or hexulose) kinase